MPKRARVTTPSLDATEPAWYEALYSGAMSDEYKAYMRDEWGHEKRGDKALFEKLSLEGAQAGLSWATILSKREGYRAAFHDFDIAKVARMTAKDVDRLLGTDTAQIVRHRGKIESVVNNAQCVQQLIADAPGPTPPYGHFDAFLWSFVGGEPVLNEWEDARAIPSESPLADKLSAALKSRGFKFVGPKICYSLLQSCGLVIDHPKGTPEYCAAKARLATRSVGAVKLKGNRSSQSSASFVAKSRKHHAK